jgi:type III pantothenate kinase
VINVTPNLVKGVKFKYKDLRKLGKDRVINAYGAYKLMGGGCLVADFGTAVTFDFISKRGVFEGGLILPGLSTALESLHEKTALLPRVDLKGKIVFPGRTSEDCMRTGVLKGYAAMTRSLIEDFKKRFRLKRCPLIVTGGHSTLIRPFLKDLRPVTFDIAFTLRSMDCLARSQDTTLNS